MFRRSRRFGVCACRGNGFRLSVLTYGTLIGFYAVYRFCRRSCDCTRVKRMRRKIKLFIAACAVMPVTCYVACPCCCGSVSQSRTNVRYRFRFVAPVALCCFSAVCRAGRVVVGNVVCKAVSLGCDHRAALSIAAFSAHHVVILAVLGTGSRSCGDSVSVHAMFFTFFADFSADAAIFPMSAAWVVLVLNICNTGFMNAFYSNFQFSRHCVCAVCRGNGDSSLARLCSLNVSDRAVLCDRNYIRRLADKCYYRVVKIFNCSSTLNMCRRSI